jgi:hypothetical protein
MFFLPLATAHGAMRNAKDEELLELANAIEALSSQVKADAISGQGEPESEIKRIQLLNDLYAKAQKFPVWPYDFANLRRFSTVVTAPLLPALVSIASELLKREIL